MKIVGLLSFFNEAPELLYASTSRVGRLGAEVVIALDGPYALYPHARVRSPSEAHQAIAQACADEGAESVIVSPPAAWEGNEVAKRNELLRLALESSRSVIGGPVAEPGDWLLVFDSDHMWEARGDWDLRDILHTGVDPIPRLSQAGEVAFADCALDEPAPGWYAARLLYRAVPGMRYVGAHWRIVFPDGAVSTTLDADREQHTARTLDLRAFFGVRHTVHHQPPERRARMVDYYDRRDAEGVEG